MTTKMFGARKKTRNKLLSNLLMEEGIDNPVNRSILYLLRNNEGMLYSELANELGLEYSRISLHVQQLIGKNILNREINSSLLSLNKTFLKDKGFIA